MYTELKVAKVRAGKTTEDLAELLGIKPAAYQRRMRTGSFSVQEALILAKYFGESVENLFADKEEKK